MSHLLFVIYSGASDTDRLAGHEYPVVGVTPSGGVWVIGEQRTLVPIDRDDYAISSVIFEEPRTTASAVGGEATQEEAYPVRVRRPRGGKA